MSKAHGMGLDEKAHGMGIVRDVSVRATLATPAGIEYAGIEYAGIEYAGIEYASIEYAGKSGGWSRLHISLHVWSFLHGVCLYACVCHMHVCVICMVATIIEWRVA